MTEAQLQKMIVDLARLSGWLCFHIYDSRKSMGAGFPDLVLVHTRTGRVIFAEIKSASGRISPAQHVWLRLLSLQSEVYTWTPAQWESDAIRRVLTSERQAAA